MPAWSARRSSEKTRPRDSVVRNLEIIGEAASRLPQEFKDHHVEIPWSRIIGLRHRVVHAYFEVDLDLVWVIVHGELSSLKAQLLAIRRAEHPGAE